VLSLRCYGGGAFLTKKICEIYFFGFPSRAYRSSW